MRSAVLATVIALAAGSAVAQTATPAAPPAAAPAATPSALDPAPAERSVATPVRAPNSRGAAFGGRGCSYGSAAIPTT